MLFDPTVLATSLHSAWNQEGVWGNRVLEGTLCSTHAFLSCALIWCSPEAPTWLTTLGGPQEPRELLHSKPWAGRTVGLQATEGLQDPLEISDFHTQACMASCSQGPLGAVVQAHSR